MHEAVIEKLKEANQSHGYFITITTLNDRKLSHYQRQKNFPKEDLFPTLKEIKLLVKTPLAIQK